MFLALRCGLLPNPQGGFAKAPLLGGRALRNCPVGNFSEGARKQERFVVEGLGVG